MAQRERVFVTRSIPEAGLVPLRAALDVDVWPERLPPPHAVLLDRLKGCAGALAMLTDRFDCETFAALPELRVLSNFAVGLNNIDLDAATARGVRVGHTPGVLTEATADIAVALLLAAARRLRESAADARAGRWLTWEPLGWLGRDLVGATLGVVGMGRIGLATARRLHHGWGMRVLYTARTPKPDAERDVKAVRRELDDLLAESDFVTLHADLNESTRLLMNAERFGRMKQTAVFVNTSRGGLVDQVALADALRSGRIFAAGLDVTDPEPLPPTHPLLALPNCVVVPHIASATVRTRDEMARVAADNLLAGLAGRPMPACANPKCAALQSLRPPGGEG